MKKSLLSLALAAASLPLAAQTTTFDFAIDGTLTHFYDAHECPSCGPDPALRDWSGTVEVTTDSFADGSYGGDSVTITVDGFRTDFRLMPMVVTLRNDRIASIDGSTVPWPAWNFSGMSITYADHGADHTGPTYGAGTLVAVSPVPEAETGALMVLGLACVARRTRKTRVLARKYWRTYVRLCRGELSQADLAW